MGGDGHGLPRVGLQHPFQGPDVPLLKFLQALVPRDLVGGVIPIFLNKGEVVLIGVRIADGLMLPEVLYGLNRQPRFSAKSAKVSTALL